MADDLEEEVARRKQEEKEKKQKEKLERVPFSKLFTFATGFSKYIIIPKI
jgi:hypothetical protein